MLEEALWFAFRVGFGPAVWCLSPRARPPAIITPSPLIPWSQEAAPQHSTGGEILNKRGPTVALGC